MDASGFPVHIKRCIHDIVEVERFSNGRNIRSELGLGDSDTVVAFLGRSRRKKGLDSFVSLLADLTDPSIRFVVAVQRTGRPNVDTYSDEELARLLADERIVHVAYRPDVESVYAVSDVVVIPSRGDEPCPAVVLEAAASGRPVVATAVGAITELVVDGETGFLVPPEDPLALLDAVKRLVEDTGLRGRMGTAAARHARRRFFEEPIEQLQTLYAEL
jgi:glycosyltransferase involved in cell wall biosynthesis